MKVLLVNSWYYPNMKGGAEQSTKLLAEGLVARGHSVAILCGDGSIDTLQSSVINGVEVYRIKTHILSIHSDFFKKIRNKLEDIEYQCLEPYFDDVCRRFSPDVIHTNSLAGISFSLWKLASERKIPVVHTIRDYSPCSPRGVYESAEDTGFPYNVFLRYYVNKSKTFSNYVSFVTAPSKFTLSRLLKDGFFPNAKSKCIVNAVPFDLNETKEYISRRKLRPEHARTAIFVGRLMPIKGIELLISCFRNIENPNIRLLICGAGESESYVVEAAKEDSRIIYCGHLTQEKLKEQYFKADFAVVPSLWDEPFGRVVIEANRYGLPVLASNRGGIPEIIKEMGSGALFDDDSEKQFMHALENFIMGLDFDMYYSNIEKNMEKYSIFRQISSFELIYDEVMGKVESSGSVTE